MGVTSLIETTQTLNSLNSIVDVDRLTNAAGIVMNPSFSNNPYGPSQFSEFPKPFQLGQYAAGEVHVIIIRQTLTGNYSKQRQAFDRAFTEKLSIRFPDIKYKRTSSLLTSYVVEEFKVKTPEELTAVIVSFGEANKYAKDQVGENPTFIQTVILGSNYANLETELQGKDTSWNIWNSDLHDGWDGIFTQTSWDPSFPTGDQLVLNLLGNGNSDIINYVKLSTPLSTGPFPIV